jgi:hypothetical protein
MAAASVIAKIMAAIIVMAKAASAKIINIGAANCGMAKQWHHASSIISEGVAAAGGGKMKIIGVAAWRHRRG